MDFLFDWKPFKTVFKHGKKKVDVIMELKPLDREGMLLILPYMRKNDKFAATGKKAEDIPPDVMESMIALQLDAQQHALSIFPNHVRNIQGITIAKEEPKPEDLASQSVFSAFVFMVFGRLATMSSLAGEDEKNLEGPSDTQKPDISE